MVAAIVCAALGIVEKAEFIGFSETEQLAAWRVEVAEPVQDGRHVDRYSLIRVTKVDGHALVARFQDSPVRRFTLEGATTESNAPRLARQHPNFANARPAAEWKRFAAQRSFGFGAALTKDSYELIPRQGRLNGIGPSPSIEGHGGVSYSVEAHLVGGRRARLGVYGITEAAGWTRARVQIIPSRTGHYVAVLNTIEIEIPGGPNKTVAQTTVLRLPGMPLKSVAGRRRTLSSSLATTFYSNTTLQTGVRSRY